MSAQVFMDALGEVNVKYVEEVLTYQCPAKRGQSRAWLKGCIAACLALILSASIVLATNTQARAAFIGWIKETYETLFVYRFEGDVNSSTEPVVYRPTWLPDGYSEFLVNDTGTSTMVAYTNEAGKILRFRYIHGSDETDWFADTTNVTIKRTRVNGNEAELFLSTDADTASGIMWSTKDGTAFLISAFLNESDLIRVAESVAEQQVLDEPKEYELAWIPEGYSEFKTIEQDGGRTVLYKNEEGKRLRFGSIHNPNTIEWYVDTANTIQSEVQINEFAANLFTATDNETASIVMWIDSNENMAFYVSAFLNEEDLIRTAESIYN